MGLSGSWIVFAQPLEVINVRSEVAEEDGDLEGVLEVGVESVDGFGGNAVGIEDPAVAGPGVRHGLEGVQAFASGSEFKQNCGLLYMRRQRVGISGELRQRTKVTLCGARDDRNLRAIVLHWL